jgi:hypothetical protein
LIAQRGFGARTWIASLACAGAIAAVCLADNGVA